ncbi:MAG: aminodeoxychorismate synthase component I [Cyclobacteriaceae bacterium]
MLKKKEAIHLLNKLGKQNIPFNFYCDFLGEEWCIEEASSKIEGSFKLSISSKIVNSHQLSVVSKEPQFRKRPIPFGEFNAAFDQVVHQINIGNSFLTNLTFRTPITTNLSLDEIFIRSSARYKLLVPDQFVVFSPETFIKIKGNHIHSYPMKGTIDASIPEAEAIILNDEKETAEHITIVDLIRNDLSQVAGNVSVEKFRYIDKIQTSDKDLLQVSSEVKGELSSDWRSNLGSIITRLLPAGSISGAPKVETIKIIQEAEDYDRGCYTGVCGHFDGESLDSGVMIRFIQQENGQLHYCSGGGITSFSDAEKEYREMIDKVYLPL